MVEKPDLRLERADLKLERANLGPGAENTDFRFERQISVLRGQISDLKEPGGWTNEQTNKRMNEQKSPCVLQDIVPFGAAALLPITYIHQHT